MEHSETSCKLPKTITQGKKLVFAKIMISLYIVRQKNLLQEKNVTTRKRSHGGYSSTYNLEILNCFNPELQLQNLQLKIN